jgi:hypothetical protein
MLSGAFLAVSVAGSLAGCITMPGTGVLVTPIGVAGVHSFAPKQTPDNMVAKAKTLDHMTAQTAKENEQNGGDKL